MSGQSPPRSRRSQPPAQIHNVQQRDTSRSPSLRDRPRPQKQTSAAAQMYSLANPTQQSLQSSPPIGTRRPSPPPGQAHRMLPTPPHPNHQIDPTQERRSASPATMHQHVPPGVQTHYPRPMHNNTARVLDKYQSEWELTDQLMGQLHLENQPPPVTQPPHISPYPPPPNSSTASSFSRDETVSPPRDPVERVRVAEARASPKDHEHQRRRDQQTAARESPKTRDRPQPALTSTSPSSTSYTLQNHSHTPENRGSPYHAGDYASPYVPHDPQPPRRNTVTQGVVPQQPSSTHSPPSAQLPVSATSTRGPDRFLPLQEEGEDDTHPLDHPPHDDDSPTHDDDLLTSDESSGARYDTNGGHASMASLTSMTSLPSINGRDDNKAIRLVPSKEDLLDDHRYPGDRDHTSEEFTPRSPTTMLPDNMMESFPSQSTAPSGVKMGNARPRPRSGVTDQLGLRGMETLMEQTGTGVGSNISTQSSPPMAQTVNDQNRQQQPFTSHRKPVPDINDPVQQPQQQTSPQQQTNQPNHQAPQQSQYQPHRGYDPRTDPRYNNRYYMMDELHNYPDDASVYFQSYIQSPRPDAPIPPTPHSQSAAPSPSPLIMGAPDYRSNRDMPYSPIAPVGSPFPFPYAHVRRPTHFPHSNNNNANSNPNANGAGAGTGAGGGGSAGGGGAGAPTPHTDQALLREQYAKQWQIYAQNHNWGAMSDSTFSPAPTPFQGAFMPWAHWHTQRMYPMMPDAMSMQSSPSHEPVPLPSRMPAQLGSGGGSGRGSVLGGQRGKVRTGSKLRRETSGSVSPPRKPPPRVESTQPRDTSPEPSSSGEETAGEDSYPTPQSSYIAPSAGGGGGGAVNGGYQAYDDRWAGDVVPVGEDADDDADWVDEDEEVDPDDLLDLEYHPSYVRTAEKRRRRWEIGWEALSQAFQTLDRQTDTTMVLVASPADSSKLHMISSRSIRRTPPLSRSPALHQLKAAFRGVAQHRRQTRSRKVPILDHFLTASSANGDGSDAGTAESREGDLRRALEAALGSLDMLKNTYEYRVARWNDEMTRMHQERDNVEFALKQLYGDRHPPPPMMMMNGLNGPPSMLSPAP